MVNTRKPTPPAERLWPRVDKSGGPNACWPWTGCTVPWGHGRIAETRGKPVQTHRVAWEDTYGAIPEGMQVLHSCDNPPCCNPKHLFLGTNAMNRADSVAKRRHQHGAGHWNAKLTPAQVRRIRASSRPYAELAEKYDVHEQTIYRIRSGVRWKELPC